MKKVLFILLCSFVSFAFTTNEKIEPISVEENAEIILPMEVKEYPIENGTITVVTPARSICDEGVVSNLIIEVDCGDGYGYSWSGKICYEHIEALVQQFQESC
ncbi:MAG: hypothetical protein ACON42_03560 [Flavobacteriaceae bacterium]